MKVRDMMSRSVEALETDSTLEEAARKMAGSDSDSLPVLSAGKPVGVITERDIVVRALAEGLKPAETTVESVMSPDVLSCREDDDVEKAVGLMTRERVERILVVNAADELTGTVALGDLAPGAPAAPAGALASLIKEELAAAETYRQALETVRGSGADELRRIESEHEEAALALSDRLQGLGGKPPSGVGLWGAWGRAIEDSERFFDERAILNILKLGEEQGAADYARAIKDGGLPSELRALIKNTLMPRTLLHASAISRLLQARAGA